MSDVDFIKDKCDPLCKNQPYAGEIKADFCREGHKCSFCTIQSLIKSHVLCRKKNKHLALRNSGVAMSTLKV